MSSLKGIGLEFDEAMRGWVCEGEENPLDGKVEGERKGGSIVFDCEIAIDDLDEFMSISDHTAELTGTITCDALGGELTIRGGRFNLFTINAETNKREMVYTCDLKNRAGHRYWLKGVKEVHDDPGIDVFRDMTTLSVHIHEGAEGGPHWGAGQVIFDLMNAPGLFASIRVTKKGGRPSLLQRVQARIAFLSFAAGVLRDEYLRDERLLYDTEYENLVLSGQLTTGGGEKKPFFFVSGVHDRDFPWGDGELFWDVLLVIGEGAGLRRFCISDRVLRGLELEVGRGVYRYRGPIYEIKEGFAASFSEMRRAQRPNLALHQADLEISFEAKPFKTSPFPFAVANDVVAGLAYGLKRALRQVLPSEHTLGIHITPHEVTVESGTLTLSGAAETSWSIEASETYGEAERSTFRNVKEPTLLYGYLCALDPSLRASRVQIHSNTIRDEPRHWAKDKIDAFVGEVVSRIASAEMVIEEGALIKVDDLGGAAPERFFTKVGDPLLEVDNDHYPTAVFKRNIVRVVDPGGGERLALEEDMDLMRRESIHSDRTVTVAALRGGDKKALLGQVLEQTGFYELLGARWQAWKAAREAEGGAPTAADFPVVIKPNFMFAYNVEDHTTYTDPELVEHLAELIHGRGFPNITLVEAQSTYGEYFANRRVLEVAEYLRYKNPTGTLDPVAKYRMVDLTEDRCEDQHFGPALGCHPVPEIWRDAGFRLSFAKCKTHAYAYYTLTLKNVYGALPKADKFKEYHCQRDIYRTTIEYLARYPVDYGLIDAFVSADGPFGIFADSQPNLTKTIIGGADLVAVDWVGATKMGLDPMVSEYMKLAVGAFGKPELDLIGDPSHYRPWLNVPVIMSELLHHGVDANHYIGNLLYMSGAYMDKDQFPFKREEALVKLARKAMLPVQEAVFLQPGGHRSGLNRLFSKVLTWLGE